MIEQPTRQESSQALSRLKGHRSLGKLVDFIYVESDCVLHLNPTWLHRVLKGSVEIPRVLDTTDLVIVFVLTMMLNGLEDGQPTEMVIKDGETALRRKLGPRAFALTFEQHVQRSRQLAQFSSSEALAEFWRVLISQWLPEEDDDERPAQRR